MTEQILGKEIDGVKYVSRGDGITDCSECVALSDDALCNALSPHSCSTIWKIYREPTMPTDKPKSESTTIQEVLTERGNRYGEFSNHAFIAQELKAVMQDTDNWKSDKLSPDMKEALEMIQHKIARILNGDPSYKDSWVDIAGYSTLVANALKD